MADAGPSAAKKAKTALPVCPYGARCYRKNPQHFKEFDHPKKDDSSSSSSSSSTTSGALTIDPSTLPPCQYGAKCYRKNLLHFAEYSHPTTVTAALSTDESGSDTDVLDSDEDEKGKATKDKDGKDILSRGMSLVKSYSQMSESERRELIKKAVEAKQKLQEELAEANKKMEEKDRELKKLQDQVNTGVLLMDGEKEALEGTKTVFFTLHAERAYKEGSAAQTHFRLAESQFYRLLTGSNAANYRITTVEYVVNPELVKRFREAREDLKSMRGEELSYPVLAFHGTVSQNIIPICETGFRVPGEKGFKHRTDTGWYGKGVYFSEYPGFSMGYIQGANKLLLCQVLPGKAYECTKITHGAKLKEGCDSHISPCKQELVIFNSHHILPTYIVNYVTAGGAGNFTYDAPGTVLSSTAEAELKDKLDKAFEALPTNVFKGHKIGFAGKCASTASKLHALVRNHGGTAVTDVNDVSILAVGDVSKDKSAKLKKAEQNKAHIVKETFIYDSIVNKKLQAFTTYAFKA